MHLPAFVCPVDRASLSNSGELLQCSAGHAYHRDPFSNVPTLFDATISPPFHASSWDPLGLNPSAYPKLGPSDVDPFVQSQIADTGGSLYRSSKLRTYPRPRFPLEPRGRTQTMVDIGSGWGRWTIAAAAKGWNVAAIDPWIDCCRALGRVARQLSPSGEIKIANADGRRLPLPDDSFDAAFSYSVLQHLPKAEAEQALLEMIRVVRPGGTVLVQMPNVRGLRQRMLYRRGVVADRDFQVRPWTFDELRRLAGSLASRNSIVADGYFSLNAQWSERRAMPYPSRAVVAASEALRRASTLVPSLIEWADSVWIRLAVEDSNVHRHGPFDPNPGGLSEP